MLNARDNPTFTPSAPAICLTEGVKIMTSFVQATQSTTHMGVERFEAVAQQLGEARRSMDGARGLAAILLAAMFAAVLVVSDHLMTTLDEGEALLAWAALWTIGLVAVALFATTARDLVSRAANAWKAGAARRASARADAQFMAYAAFDPRVMHELEAAVSRHQSELEATGPAAAVVKTPRTKTNAIPSLYEASRRTRMAYYY